MVKRYKVSGVQIQIEDFPYKILCPYCGSLEIWRCGIFCYKKRGVIQRWKCKHCKRTFFLE